MDGPIWTRLGSLPRVRAAELRTRLGDVPAAPGVYTWWRDGAAVYAGVAANSGGLRDRLRAHLATGLDISRSSLRRNVAESLLGIPTAVSRLRPSVMTVAQIEAVNAWVGELEIAWLVLSSPLDAKAYEHAMHSEWMPPLSKRG